MISNAEDKKSVLRVSGHSAIGAVLLDPGIVAKQGEES